MSEGEASEVSRVEHVSGDTQVWEQRILMNMGAGNHADSNPRPELRSVRGGCHTLTDATR